MFSFCFLGCFPLQLSPSVLWYCWLGLLTCKNRLLYNLYCVGGDVKHCTIQSNTWLVDKNSSAVHVTPVKSTLGQQHYRPQRCVSLGTRVLRDTAESCASVAKLFCSAKWDVKNKYTNRLVIRITMSSWCACNCWTAEHRRRPSRDNSSSPPPSAAAAAVQTQQPQSASPPHVTGVDVDQVETESRETPSADDSGMCVRQSNWYHFNNLLLYSDMARV